MLKHLGMRPASLAAVTLATAALATAALATSSSGAARAAQGNGTASFPGTDDGLILATGVGPGAPTTVDQKVAAAGAALSVLVTSTNTALDGALLVLGVNVTAPGAVLTPSLPGLALDLTQPLLQVPLGSSSSAAPTAVDLTLDPALGGLDLTLQAIAVPAANPAAAANGLFAATDGHRIAVEPASGPVVITEDERIIAADTTVGDNFGFAVDLDDGRLAVGAPFDDVIDLDAGSAYLFDVETGGQLQKFTAPFLGGFGDNYGTAVALLGTQLAVGAPRENAVTTLSGIVYTYDGPSGQSGPTLVPTGSGGATPVGHSIGESLAVTDSLIVAGTRGDSFLAPGGGSVHVFSAQTLNLIGKLFPDDPGFADNFGDAVAASGNLVAVGSPFDDGNANDSGSAYVFDAQTGQQLHKFAPDDTGENDLFGLFLAMEGTTVVVGAPFLNDRGVINAGAVYLFDAISGAQLARLTSPAPGSNGRFGDGLALDANYLLIGESLGFDSDGTPAGVVHVYDRDTLDLLFRLEASAGQPEDALGESIAIDGQRVAVGARGSDVAGELAGAVYLFTLP